MSCCGTSGASFVQTRFCGATIVQFSTQIGWNDTGSNLFTVEVVEDRGNGPRAVYSNGSWSIVSEADSFSPPEIGSPVTLAYGSLIVSGILQNWQEMDSATGAKKYSLSVISGAEILRGVQVILENYSGPTFGVPNLINVYGYLEANGNSCAEGGFADYSSSGYGFADDMSYTPAPGFGDAGKTASGIPWNSIRSALTMACNGVSSYGSVIKFHGHNYYLDISELPLLNGSVCIGGDNMSLLDIIARVCELAGVDYFIELLPNTGGGNFIKVRTATAPSNASTIGSIARTISNMSCISDYSKGLEMRSDYTCSFITGDFRQDMWQMYYTGNGDAWSDTIWPYWGRDVDTTIIKGTGYGDSHSFAIKTGHLGIGIDSYVVDVLELRCALIGESAWRNYVVYAANNGNSSKEDAVNAIEIVPESAIVSDGFLAEAHENGLAKPIDWVALDNSSVAQSARAADVNIKWNRGTILYNYIRGFAENFYGRKFMVKVPLCKAYNAETPWTWEGNWTVTDSAWAEKPIIGVPLDHTIIESFRGEDGRIRGFARILSTTGFSPDMVGRGDDVYYLSPYEAYVGLEAKEIIWCSPTDARVVVELTTPMQENNPKPILPTHMLGFIMDGRSVDEFNTSCNRPGGDRLAIGCAEAMLMPIAVAVPLQSKRLVYGPWFAQNVDNPVFTFMGTTVGYGGSDKGLTSYERDPSFAPWNFGSRALMNQVAFMTACARLGTTFVLEKGQITYPGAPSGRLGSALDVAGPVVTGIDVSVGRGEAAIQTTVTFKTYTPDYGKLNKARIDSIRHATEIGIRANRYYRGLRMEYFRRQVVHGWQRMLRQAAIQNTGMSSHDIFSATAMADPANSDHARSYVVVTEARKERPSFGANDDAAYRETAFAESNSIFRPFSTSPRSNPNSTSPGGAADGTYMSHFETDTQWVSTDHSSYRDPIPFGESTTPITSRTLNPFTSSYSSLGHDIEYIARDGVYPTHMCIRHPSDNYSTENWYRAIALRGPLIIAGWGYDIDGKPVPNSSANYPNKPTTDFAEDWLRKPYMWKCGPVDLRWDYVRKVWTSPAPFNLVQVMASSNIFPGEWGYCIQFPTQTKYDYAGNPIDKKTIGYDSGYSTTVINNLTKPLFRGHKGWAICRPSADIDELWGGEVYDSLELVEIDDDIPYVIVEITEPTYNTGENSLGLTIQGKIISVVNNSVNTNNVLTTRDINYDEFWSPLKDVKIHLSNPCKIPVCNGTKVVCKITHFRDTNSIAEDLNINEREESIFYAYGIILQTEAKKLCVVTKLEMLEYRCWGQDTRWDEEEVEIKVPGQINTTLDKPKITGQIPLAAHKHPIPGGGQAPLDAHANLPLHTHPITGLTVVSRTTMASFPHTHHISKPCTIESIVSNGNLPSHTHSVTMQGTVEGTTVTVPAHSHSVSVSGDISATGTESGGHTHTVSGGSITTNASSANYSHSHNVNLTGGTGSAQVAAHSHTVTISGIAGYVPIPGHSHFLNGTGTTDPYTTAFQPHCSVVPTDDFGLSVDLNIQCSTNCSLSGTYCNCGISCSCSITQAVGYVNAASIVNGLGIACDPYELTIPSLTVHLGEDAVAESNESTTSDVIFTSQGSGATSSDATTASLSNISISGSTDSDSGSITIPALSGSVTGLTLSSGNVTVQVTGSVTCSGSTGSGGGTTITIPSQSISGSSSQTGGSSSAQITVTANNVGFTLDTDTGDATPSEFQLPQITSELLNQATTATNDGQDIPISGNAIIPTDTDENPEVPLDTSGLVIDITGKNEWQTNGGTLKIKVEYINYWEYYWYDLCICTEQIYAFGTGKSNCVLNKTETCNTSTDESQDGYYSECPTTTDDGTCPEPSGRHDVGKVTWLEGEEDRILTVDFIPGAELGDGTVVTS